MWNYNFNSNYTKLYTNSNVKSEILDYTKQQTPNLELDKQLTTDSLSNSYLDHSISEYSEKKKFQNNDQFSMVNNKQENYLNSIYTHNNYFNENHLDRWQNTCIKYGTNLLKNYENSLDADYKTQVCDDLYINYMSYYNNSNSYSWPNNNGNFSSYYSKFNCRAKTNIDVNYTNVMKRKKKRKFDKLNYNIVKTYKGLNNIQLVNNNMFSSICDNGYCKNVQNKNSVNHLIPYSNAYFYYCKSYEIDKNKKLDKYNQTYVDDSLNTMYKNREYYYNHSNPSMTDFQYGKNNLYNNFPYTNYSYYIDDILLKHCEQAMKVIDDVQNIDIQKSTSCNYILEKAIVMQNWLCSIQEKDNNIRKSSFETALKSASIAARGIREHDWKGIIEKILTVLDDKKLIDNNSKLYINMLYCSDKDNCNIKEESMKINSNTNIENKDNCTGEAQANIAKLDLINISNVLYESMQDFINKLGEINNLRIVVADKAKLGDELLSNYYKLTNIYLINNIYAIMQICQNSNDENLQLTASKLKLMFSGKFAHEFNAKLSLHLLNSLSIVYFTLFYRSNCKLFAKSDHKEASIKYTLEIIKIIINSSNLQLDEIKYICNALLSEHYYEETKNNILIGYFNTKKQNDIETTFCALEIIKAFNKQVHHKSRIKITQRKALMILASIEQFYSSSLKIYKNDNDIQNDALSLKHTYFAIASIYNVCSLIHPYSKIVFFDIKRHISILSYILSFYNSDTGLFKNQLNNDDCIYQTYYAILIIEYLDGLASFRTRHDQNTSFSSIVNKATFDIIKEKLKLGDHIMSLNTHDALLTLHEKMRKELYNITKFEQLLSKFSNRSNENTTLALNKLAINQQSTLYINFHYLFTIVYFIYQTII